jgi:uncharacterized protein YggE
VFPKLVDDFIALGGIEFSGINSGLAKQTELEGEVWDKAVANARERAEKTVKAMNVKVDSVFAVSPVPILDITSTMFPSEQVAAVRALQAPEGGNPSEYRLAPITVTQVVHVIYLISPAK